MLDTCEGDAGHLASYAFDIWVNRGFGDMRNNIAALEHRDRMYSISIIHWPSFRTTHDAEAVPPGGIR
jgi:hypothetical protein